MVIIDPNVIEKIQNQIEVNEFKFGFLYGKEIGGEKYISSLLSLSNTANEVSPTPHHFQKGLAFAEKNQLELLGVYILSNTESAIPSESDQDKAVPFLSYLVFSEQAIQNNLRAWVLDDEGFFEEEILFVLQNR